MKLSSLSNLLGWFKIQSNYRYDFIISFSNYSILNCIYLFFIFCHTFIFCIYYKISLFLYFIIKNSLRKKHIFESNFKIIKKRIDSNLGL